MKTAIVIGVLIGMLGCAEQPNATCNVPPTSVIGYSDCNATLPDGSEAVTLCGELPADGTNGNLLPVGCKVQIGTSTPETATCLEVCP